MSKLDKYIDRYNLKILKIGKIDLTKTYFQFRPEYKDNNLCMIDSPHYELASLYYKYGIKWLKKNFNKTKYFIFNKNILHLNVNIPRKKIILFDSIKDGYLRRKYKNDYIVVLDKPLIESRYGVKNIFLKSPEVFIGHHRVGALLALNINIVKVMIAKDNRPGSCQCYGKIHNVYKKIN